VLLKRKVEGRSKPFDELVAEHKAIKEAAVAAAKAPHATTATSTPPTVATVVAPSRQSQQQQQPSSLRVESVLNSIVEPNPLDQHQKPKLAILGACRRPASGPTSWIVPPSTLLSASPTKHGGGGRRSCESDENLHYTIDHPRPMAVCTFGAKRLANGSFLLDRSHLLPRKAIRLSIDASVVDSGGLRIRSRPNSRATSAGGGIKHPQNCSV